MKTQHIAKSLLLIQLGIMFPINTYATTYCIDREAVEETTCDYVLTSISEVDNLMSNNKLQAGDNVLFNRGDVWTEQLDIKVSGVAGLPITFGAYGDINLPNPTIEWDFNLFNKRNGGFERVEGNIDDDVSDDFDKWYEGNNGGLNYIAAISNIEDGNTAVKIHHDINENVDPFLRNNIALVKAGVEYYIDLYARIDAMSREGLRIRIRDMVNNKDLQDDGTWSEQFNLLEEFSVSSTDTWENVSKEFITEPTGDSNGNIQLRIDIVADIPGTTAYVDNIYLQENSSR
ncbi:MAG: hypothetical protein GXP22_09250, partial [Gammaproteobacteria bacterium]|nr:hypothetical protein [Gammaproteobacteria bacterium]